MSAVTGILIIAHPVDEEAAHEIHPDLKMIDDYAGGIKHPEFSAHAAGINYLSQDDKEKLIMRFLSTEWCEPQRAILIITKDEERAQVIRP